MHSLVHLYLVYLSHFLYLHDIDQWEDKWLPNNQQTEEFQNLL